MESAVVVNINQLTMHEEAMMKSDCCFGWRTAEKQVRHCNLKAHCRKENAPTKLDKL